MDKTSHPYIPTLLDQLNEGEISRRDFLRKSTLLGLSAGAAYAMAGIIDPATQARAGDLPKGGNLRIGMRCMEIKDPHLADFAEKSNVIRQVCEYLTFTDRNNITHPYLLEKWDVSDDLKTWTLHIRKDVKWRDGRALNADDVVWNLKRVSDPKVGSSVLGLFTGYLVEEYDTGEKDDNGNPKKSSRLWSDKAIEKVDDSTVRLNLFSPQIAVAEHLFHYPMFILDPKDNGAFGPSANGTGPFEMVEYTVGKGAKYKARADYWGGAAHLDTFEFVDLGDNPGAGIAAMASKQVDGLSEADAVQINSMKAFPHVSVHKVETTQTIVMRMHPDVEQFKDKRVRQAMRHALDRDKIIQTVLLGAGTLAEDHHVAPSHPEYAALPKWPRDVEKAKKLMADAGHADGFEVDLVTRPDPIWELNTTQAMAEQLKDIGIKANIKSLPSAQYWEVWTSAPFSLTAWGHRPLAITTLGLAYRSNAAWNESHFSNAEFDKLLTQAEGILDPKERSKVMEKIELIMQDEGPIVQPFWRIFSTVMDKKVQGFELHPSQYIFAKDYAVASA
ncbi:ABC transporter substrate-binding protein [Mesorhizobium sp. M1A.F.Ca.IN.020.32.1.1]|uniref:ABC transporter substrate-binding protein n=1 Tax=Mesorhizobium sp. M1A.F.Ca.IN.020.32.1.1 TaxID=2496763 RepID=UPI000FD52D36|nr:ABC transporter substrate-binding protein [Mesorhizobium sp. M1A.F.Ca.IN.020.32.1.1]RUV89919.1 ABC transporter substrate-binding protein [Mesorhizobium sp. M1A.F.Ca.IN.020.32.1.1]